MLSMKRTDAYQIILPMWFWCEACKGATRLLRRFNFVVHVNSSRIQMSIGEAFGVLGIVVGVFLCI
jgi:tetrahydromethanopterin S-methyltransferase subunit G